MSHKTPHQSCPRGKKVHVRLLNGDEFTARFHEKRSRWIYFTDPSRKVVRGDVVQFTILR